jgi:formiminotetrahydrofolate cyclodeaminase
VSGSAGMTLEEVLDSLASDSPAPGAGAAAAWCCGLSAALVEMVARVRLARGEERPVMDSRRRRSAELRAEALRLAEVDAAAYRAAMEAPSKRRREAIAAAADPPLAIAEAAAETEALAAASAADATGPVRGEADTAVLVAGAATRAAARLVELNLAGMPDDPRLARARELAKRVGSAPPG